jgi:hypothetical protein
MSAMRRKRRIEQRKANDLVRLLVALDRHAAEARPPRSARAAAVVLLSR